MEKILKYTKGDKGIWLISLLLAIASILVVYSSVVTLAYKKFDGNPFPVIFKHVIILGLGFCIMYVIHKVKYRYFSRIAQVLLMVSIPLLLITLLVGANMNNASRWLVIPVINQTFQTSDLAKLALIMYVARMLSLKQNNIKNLQKAFLPIVIPILVVCGLILPANLSTAAVLFTSCLVLMFIGRINLKYIFALIGTGIAALGLVFLIASVYPAAFPRVQTWINRVDNFGKKESKGNYQIEQSKIAIATGGITGKGPGNSTQRNFLPHPYSDFIYAIVIEEYGLFGGGIILILYLVLLFRCIRIVIKCPDSFGSLLVIGISFSLVFQACINMAVAVNILPVTGQPLPMISMGGTSIWFTCIAIGIILSVSQGQSTEKEDKTANKIQYGAA